VSDTGRKRDGEVCCVGSVTYRPSCCPVRARRRAVRWLP
jgi:hypothetical protein